MENSIQHKIIEYLKPASEGRTVADVRVGLGYTSVRLDNGNTGLAWTARSNSESCTHQAQAGTLAGRTALEMLELLGSDSNALARTIGLATANALAAGVPRPEFRKEDALDLVNITAADRVVMVGFFGPLVPVIKMTGCKFDILELNRRPGTLTPEEGQSALAACTVAIITATSIITGTLDSLLAGLGTPRAVIILGPSTFMLPGVFSGTPVTHLAGSWVLNAPAVEQIVSEGGGTMLLKKHLQFATVCL